MGSVKNGLPVPDAGALSAFNTLGCKPLNTCDGTECAESKVCLHEKEIVVVDSPSEIQPLNLHTVDVKGNHYSPVSYRRAVTDHEFFAASPALNVTPILFYPIFPTNVGETVHRFVNAWVQASADTPQLKDMPVAVVMPNLTEMPSFFKLVESLGPGVTSFSTVAGAGSCSGQPICFKQVYGCDHNLEAEPNPWLNPAGWKERAPKKKAMWGEFREKVIDDRCPDHESVEEKRTPLRNASRSTFVVETKQIKKKKNCGRLCKKAWWGR